MLDIVGIGTLNVDYTATSEAVSGMNGKKLEEAMKSFEYGAERLADEEGIARIISILGKDSFGAALGGSAFNTICCIASLGSDLKAGFSGISGETGRPELSFEGTFENLGVDTSFLAGCSGESSGRCVSINQSGTRSFVYYHGCNSRMGGFLRGNYRRLLEYVSGARLLHITQFSDSETSELLHKLAEDAKKANPGLLLSCDPGYTWLKNLEPSVAGILRLADFLFLNEREFTLLSGEKGEVPDAAKAERISAELGLSGMKILVKKETEIKLYRMDVCTAEESSFSIDVIGADKIIDATGAGDAFDAGYLAAVLTGEAEEKLAVELGMMLMRVKLETEPENLREAFEGAFERWKAAAGY
jgi:sugar/nucleoside kinase (ribokinase family)